MTITKSAENVTCEPPPDPYSHLMVDFSKCARLPIHLLVNCSGRGRGTSSRVRLKSRRDASFPKRLLASQMVLWYRRAVQEPERPSRPPCVKHETTPSAEMLSLMTTQASRPLPSLAARSQRSTRRSIGGRTPQLRGAGLGRAQSIPAGDLRDASATPSIASMIFRVL